jgi:uncharacterized protein (DUF2235 family)
MPKKRLILLLDGTWNDVDDNTSVWRMCQLLAREDAKGMKQEVYYDRGVGTAAGTALAGGAIGFGLDDNVIAAYRWLMGVYDQYGTPGVKKGRDFDEIYVLGFSRGAYTARSLTGFIRRCGLLRPGAPLSVEEMFKRYREQADAPSLVEMYRMREEGKPVGRINERVLKHSRRVKIKMIGVWDTVGALGIPFGKWAISRSKAGFHDTDLSTLYDHAYQALAIDEHREAFAPTLWTRRPDAELPRTSVEQRWFIGAHANVGGGVSEDDLPQMPLAWMIEKMAALGVAFRGGVTPEPDDVMCAVSDSFSEFMRGVYKVVKMGNRFHRPIGAEIVQTPSGPRIPIGETIDGSVFDRWRRDPQYRPFGIVEWANRKCVKPEKFTGPVSAATGLPL